jgi:hypothetical protein
MKAEDIKFRCHELGALMTEARSGSGLSETTKTALLRIYARIKYGYEEEITSKYIEKGLAVEEDGITLYSRVSKTLFLKNETRIENGYISGLPDLYKGELNKHVELVPDIKCPYDMINFLSAKYSPVNKMYYWQIMGYLWLLNCKHGKIVYCLVNTPQNLIEYEKTKYINRTNGQNISTETMEKALADIERHYIYDHIPIEERVHEVDILYDQEAIDKLTARIIQCREYLVDTLKI